MAGLRLRRDGVAWSDLDGEIVILDLRSSTYFSVRGTAAFLVTELVDGTSADALVERLLDTYDTTEETARTDVGAFIDELKNRDLLEHSHG